MNANVVLVAGLAVLVLGAIFDRELLIGIGILVAVLAMISYD